jgi:hypothetical protein
MVGADVRIFINQTLYPQAQSVSWSMDYGESEIYGIDSVLPQEIAPGRNSVSGQIQGLRVTHSGGLQAVGARGLVTQLLSAPYVSIRIQDRRTGEDLLFVPRAKVSQQSHQAATKGVVRMSFAFKGLVPFEPLDRNQ